MWRPLAAERVSAAAISTVQPTDEEIRDAAFSSTWLNLCHYKKSIFGSYESLVAGTAFFLAPDGKVNPESELRETLFLYSSACPPALTARRYDFPARLRFINMRFALHMPEYRSAEYDQFRMKTDGRSVSVVYSSYFMNNPSSVFGHTFMKLETDKPDLLEYGINFAAQVQASASPLYLIRGLAGRYAGKYSLIPFYEKVREYNDFENRDLWVYHLDLTENQKDLYYSHLWELMHTHYDYYFFTKNCAYHTLSSFDALFSDKPISDRGRYFCIPVDAIKELYAANLISHAELLPSLRSIFLSHFETLSALQRKSFFAVTDGRIPPEETDNAVLEAVIAYYNYRYPSAKLDILADTDESRIFALKRSLVLIRSSRAPDSSELATPAISKVSPHLMHGSRRFGVYGGFFPGSASGYFRAEYRGAYHDISDPSRGYPVNTELELGKVSINISKRNEKSRARLNEALLVHISAYNDLSFYHKALSWSMYAGGKRIRKVSATDPDSTFFAPLGRLSLGLAKIVAPAGRADAAPALILYVMLGSSLSYHSSHDSGNVQKGLGPVCGIKAALSDSVVLAGSLEQYWHARDSYQRTWSGELHWEFVQDISLAAHYERSDSVNELRGGVRFYF